MLYIFQTGIAAFTQKNSRRILRKIDLRNLLGFNHSKQPAYGRGYEPLVSKDSFSEVDILKSAFF